MQSNSSISKAKSLDQLLLLHMQVMLSLSRVDKLGTSTAKTIAFRAMNSFFWEGGGGEQNLYLMSVSLSVLISTWVGKH